MLVTAAAVLVAASPVGAADVDAGRSKSATCAACHGPTGRSTNPLWPNLAGQNEAYLVKQIKAFKTGERTDPNMNAMVAALSDEDIADLAAFFAAQSCQ
jgi:cytochrome c553